MINKRYLHTAQLGILLLAGLTLQAWGQGVAGIGASYKQYASQTLQEKIYAHTDKTWYFTGELVWFKLYVVDANTRQQLSVSKVAYVDVLDDANNPVLQAKIALKDGLGNGSLYLPVTLANGNYKLRAYTNWMKNFGPDVFFEKQLSIVNPLKSPEAVAVAVKADQDIQFFPEGGQLVNGLPATIGFKAVDAMGNGTAVNGVVITQRNDTVARFRSGLYGMGRFNFTPIAGTTYKAVMRVAGNNVLIKELPAAETRGYSMHMVTEGSQVKLFVYSRDEDQNNEVYILAHSGAGVSLAQVIKMSPDNVGTIIIDKSRLGEGINHFTLFNANRQPVCERLCFKRPKLLNVQAATQARYSRRHKVDIDITAKSDAGTAQKSNLSLAVYRLDSLNNYSDEDIASYLWLSADVKGRIEHPGYYLTHTNEDTDIALDNLLLTQGWSRFKWDEALNSGAATAFKYLPEYNGHIISGKLTDAGGAPANHVITYLGVISKRAQLYGASAETGGQLYFNTRNFYGPNEIVLQNNWTKDSIYHVTINSPFFDQYSALKVQPFRLGKQTSTQLEAGSVGMQVQNLYKPENMRQFYSPGIDSSAFWENNYKTYLLDNYTRFTTIEEVLREYVTEVNVQKTQGHFHIKMIGPSGYYLPEDPLVLLDGVPVFNPDKVFTIDPLKIRRLDDVTSYYWGPTSNFGILSFASYKTDFGGFELDPRAVVLDYEGMQLQREFYSPVYDTEASQKSRLPDFRNVLYWQPDVTTAADGKARASFYTSDRAGRYIGVVQGLSANGQAGSGYVIFDVD
jgi:hypothetical protein